MKRIIFASMAAAVALTALSGCGISEKDIRSAESRLAALEEKGVPDSLLSDAKIYIQQAKDGLMRHNNGFAREGRDSARICLGNAESFVKEEDARLKASVDGLMASLRSKSSQLSGLHKATADSSISVVDSLIGKSWYFQAEAKAQESVALLDTLAAMQVRAEELAPQVPGVWKCQNKYTSKEFKEVNAVENKIFTFSPDGKAHLVENKKGTSAPTLKEDWEFNSYGTWALRGDTIFLAISRFQIVRQNFWKKARPDDAWKAEPGPTYDSTFTDHSQDRFVVWGDLNLDFKK